ncbi:MAG: hypothetical protein J6A21_04380 [Lentisphaeria bacterium]|nr:hypothetical protein [Lentisphaeria bacterium]
MAFADTLPDNVRKRSRFFAIASTIFGCVPEIMVDSNSILILYIVMLGGSEAFSMFSSSVSSIASMCMLIPFAGVAARVGLKKTNTISCFLAGLAFLIMACAPFFGKWGCYVVIGTIFLFALTRPLYGSCWYPMLDAFLRSDERGSFFGRMRFTYMIFNTCLYFLYSRILGASPSIVLLQCILVFTGFMALGRKFCMDQFPLDPASASEDKLKISRALGICLKNSPLVGFSVYMCFLNLAFSAGLPLGIIYMKHYLKLGAGVIVMITTMELVGKLFGYAVMNKVLKTAGMRGLLLSAHALVFIVGVLLFLSFPFFSKVAWILGTAFFLTGITGAFLLCISSMEMLALARPGNKIMAMAFCGTVSSLGIVAGRLGTTLVLGCTVFQTRWQVWGLELTKYHFLFAVSTILAVFIVILFPLVPAIIREHEDYYNPAK